VRGVAVKFFVALMLTLCASVYVLETSGRWDRTLQDANDEAGFVAIVLCIGVAFSVAGSLVTQIRTSRTRSLIVFASQTTRRPDDVFVALPVSASSPPLSLRI
jgi:hypothetical protein